MAEYEELKTKIVVEADTKGADKAEKAIESVGKTAKKTAVTTKDAMKSVEFALNVTKAEALAAKIQSTGEKLHKVLNSDKQDLGKIGDYVTRIQNLNDKYQKEIAPKPTEITAAERISGGAGDEVARTFASGNVSRFISSIKDDAVGALGKLASVGGKAAGVLANIGKQMGKSAVNRVTSFSKGISSVAGAFKRIMFYRAVRTIIKEIGAAFKEGVDNLYQWSKLLNSDFAKSMDKISTAGLYMKNSLGAMVAPLINALAPAVDYLIDRFVDLINVINQVFSVIAGATSWTKAIKYPKEYAKAVGGAASSAKKLGLAGIDQLTILDKNRGSSGSGFSAEDYAGMFEKQKLGSIWDDVRKAIEGGQWREAGKLLADKLNSVVDNFDAKAWGSKIGTKINNGLEFTYGFISNVSFSSIGSKFADFLNGAFEEINTDTLGRILSYKLIGVLDFALGFIETFNWKQFGQKVSDFFTGSLNEINSWADGIDWPKVAIDIEQGFFDFLGEIKWGEIAKEAFHLLGLAFGVAVETIMFAIADCIDSIVGYFRKYIEDENGDGKFGGEEIIKGLLEGIGDGMKNIGKWIVDNIFTPFVDGICQAFGIASPAKEMKPLGGNVIEGFKEGALEKWNNFLTTMKTKWNDFKNWWRNLELPTFRIKTPHLSWSTEPAGGWVANILSTLGLPASLPKLNVSWYAQGGFPDAGQLFIANEAGAEMVGSMNGRTAVANNDQIVEGIEEGVFNAVMSAMRNGGFSANVYLDGKQISGSVVKNVNNEIRRTGRSPILSY